RAAGSQHHLQRENEPHKLAARGDFHQGPRLGARVSPDEEGDAVDAVRPSLGQGNTVYIGDEARLVELQRAEFDHDLLVETLRRLCTRLAQIERQRLVALPRDLGRAGKLTALGLAVVECDKLSLEAPNQRGQIVDHDLMLAGEPAERKESLFCALELLRLE